MPADLIILSLCVASKTWGCDTMFLIYKCCERSDQLTLNVRIITWNKKE